MGFALSLSASRTASRGGAAALERISKTVHLRAGKEGELKERSLRQLSGGERRRVALALALGFAQLVSARGRLRCNMLVLDEVRDPRQNVKAWKVVQLPCGAAQSSLNCKRVCELAQPLA